MKRKNSAFLKARPYFIFLLAALLSFATIIYLEVKDVRMEIENDYTSSDGYLRPRLTPLDDMALTRPIQKQSSEAHKETVQQAEIAWVYFVNNTDPETGLSNSAHLYPSTTMWDTASYLIAIVDAVNAAFCCGAGSIHRRTALIDNMQREDKTSTITKDSTGKVTPFNFHVSEDIFTSTRFHGDPRRKWLSFQHPKILCAMVSPLDMLSLQIQRFKYAGGSLELGFKRWVWLDKGMSFQQKLAYFSTFFSYLSCLWISIFLITPALFLLTGDQPLEAFGFDFFKRFLPFFFATEAANLTLNWGYNSFKSRSASLAGFSVNLSALFTVLRGKEIKFKVTPKTRTSGRYNKLVWPQWMILLLNFCAAVYAVLIYQTGFSNLDLSDLVIGCFWAIASGSAMYGFIKAANWQPIRP